ncbi:MAG: hypothetical protein OEY11_14845 [Gammaproteobacteria bacterium]|nr:hypothetical protein [Gammaproteobacteria bacterium]
MKILDNEKEMIRLYEQYIASVKDKYKCDMDRFRDWLVTDGHENEETGEMYIEIPGNETLSGHAEILDW